jgi:hypothetical protein
VLKIRENYITELYDRPNRLETLEVEPEEECYGKICFQQEESSFYWHIGLKFEEEISEMLHLEFSLKLC